MESVKLPAGYLLPPGKTMADIREITLDLLAGEGLDVEALKAGEAPGDEPDADE
jgi:hypothetical protein